jgi:hypothetical protein
MSTNSVLDICSSTLRMQASRVSYLRTSYGLVPGPALN